MSKAELLEEISKLTPEERSEIWDALWTLEERQLLGSNAPSDHEKAVLDREMEDYEKNPWVGASWEEVEARLRRSEEGFLIGRLPILPRGVDFAQIPE